MTALPVPTQRFTPQEYLRLENAAESKHEFHAGDILAMSGGTYRHSRIISNLNGELRSRLKSSPCFPLESNMRVRIAAQDRYVYPDASVVCGEPQFDPLDKNQTTIINPRVVIEVLSDSTEAYDRGKKFAAYRALTSMQLYVLVSQNTAVGRNLPPSRRWHLALRRLARRGRCRALPGLQVDLPLAEVYFGLTFEPPAESLPADAKG